MARPEQGKTVARLVALILQAQRGQLGSRKSLAHEYGVSERTIYRDLLEIERHLPIQGRKETA